MTTTTTKHSADFEASVEQQMEYFNLLLDNHGKGALKMLASMAALPNECPNKVAAIRVLQAAVTVAFDAADEFYADRMEQAWLDAASWGKQLMEALPGDEVEAGHKVVQYVDASDDGMLF